MCVCLLSWKGAARRLTAAALLFCSLYVVFRAVVWQVIGRALFDIVRRLGVDRVVLLVNFWHPALPPAERQIKINSFGYEPI